MGDVIALKKGGQAKEVEILEPEQEDSTEYGDGDGGGGIDLQLMAGRVYIISYQERSFDEPYHVKWGLDDADTYLASIQRGNERKLEIVGVFESTFWEGLQFRWHMREHQIQDLDWYLPNPLLSFALHRLETEDA